jgi:hypothetical protein
MALEADVLAGINAGKLSEAVPSSDRFGKICRKAV